MVNLVETLFVITIVSLLIAGLAYIQSRSGGERQVKYRARMQRFLRLAIVCGVVAAVLELMLRP